MARQRAVSNAVESREHGDCMGNGWCRRLQGGGSTCTPFVGLGQSCGGFVAPGARTRCAPGLTCWKSPLTNTDFSATCEYTRFSDEQIVAILRETDRTTVTADAKKNKVSEQTIYAWRKQFGQLEPTDVGLLRALSADGIRPNSVRRPSTAGGGALIPTLELGLARFRGRDVLLQAK